MNIISILLGIIGMNEWWIILLAIVIMFGGRKIPELMKGLGKGIREFNNAKNDVKQHIEDGMRDNGKEE
ncbi:MAG: twin-arginine translocase TatA/TatE family subunit [Flavobacteriales bacterium]|nr:twin-arginine translocase TatA/TatE family subunit [Flavobacteriales bacterium]